jgi:hypothetical protein
MHKILCTRGLAGTATYKRRKSARHTTLRKENKVAFAAQSSQVLRLFFRPVLCISQVIRNGSPAKEVTVAGNVTMVYEAIGFSTSQAFAIEDSISDNTWSAPVLLSGGDTVSQIYFSVSPNGSAIAAWLSSGGVAAIRASIRAGSAAAWGTPVTVSAPGSTEIGPEQPRSVTRAAQSSFTPATMRPRSTPSTR